MFDIIPLKLKPNSLNKKRSLIDEYRNDHIISKRALSDDLKQKSDYSILDPDYIIPASNSSKFFYIKNHGTILVFVTRLYK